MPTIPRSQNHLAQLLGIDKSTCSLAAKRGMPTHSLEAAQAWRRANLEPGRVKGMRMGTTAPPPPPQPVRSAALRHAEALTKAAALVLEAGGLIDAMLPNLRPALAAVPPWERADLEIDLAVWQVLVAHVMPAFDADEAASPDSTRASDPVIDKDAEWMGVFWYQVAAGEWVLNPT